MLQRTVMGETAGSAGRRTSARSAFYRRLAGLLVDTRGQAMTEYVIITAMMVAVAAYLYHPDNLVFNGIRGLFDRTSLLMKLPGP